MSILDNAIDAFLALIRSSWPTIEQTLVVDAGWDYSVVYDWAQANWEMIVEAAVAREEPVALEVYAAGADCNSDSSRVWNPSTLPTHSVACRAASTGKPVRDQLSGRDVTLPKDGLALMEFVTMSDGWYVVAPPFDCALLREGGVEVVVRLSDVAFGLIPVDDSA